MLIETSGEALTGVMVVEVPQWQGSFSETAPRLREGAARLAAMIPAAERVRVDVGPTLAETAERTRTVLSCVRDRFVVTVGGGCGVALSPVAEALRRYGDRLAVVWCDAHGDLNTPDSSPSGSFDGMVVRTLLGDGLPELVPDRTLSPGQVVFAGTRALDPAEHSYAGHHQLHMPDLSDLVEEVGKTAAEAVHLHIDLDVLDPRRFSEVGAPEPGGVPPEEFIARIAALAERFEIVGLSLAGYRPVQLGENALLATFVPELVRICRASSARQIELRAARAWPAPVIREHRGWLFRCTPGVSRKRSNSALPPLQPALELDAVGSFYRDRGMPSQVQVSPAEHHRELDALLEARGYRLGGETVVLKAATDTVIAATAATLTADVADDPHRWLDAFAELDGSTDAFLVGQEIISRIPAPVAFLSVVRDGRVDGLGLFAADSGWAGVFCMVTRPEARRRGVATTLLGAGARWASTQGIQRMYLQVEKDNEAARRLYAGIGFTHSHSYHYRTRP
ncbi:GNAT family N-acetyltransferase [Rhizohabitans arisaemae]|uniref:GNAT family N-acetyltransferase n=1 Tax=Rhizohabitans arisaemae TaxID=2720610 RepID=UPI0024B20DF6|nr:GNAT family N-acetyltransferase [Rhizohabitans arisaemae]